MLECYFRFAAKSCWQNKVPTRVYKTIDRRHHRLPLRRDPGRQTGGERYL
jgi:hypothetical protein